MRSGINPNSTFSEQFHAYPVAMYPGKDMEHLNLSGRILMPPSSLHILSHMNIEMPMKFELTNVGISSKTTHAGVLEFIAEEGKVYLPQWMMRSLLLTPGAIVRVRNVDMGLGDFIKLEPQSVAFLDISDARAVLERALREYTTMTVGDVFPIKYGDIQFDMKVLETPNTDGNVGRGTGISVVETDLQVDFAPPVGYVEPQRPSTPAQSTPGTSRPGSRMAAGSGMDISHAVVEPVQKWSPFQGAGTSLRPPSAAPSRPFKRSPLANSTPSNKGSEEPTEPDAESVKDKTPKPIVLRPGELYFGWSTPVIVAGDDGKDNKEASTDSPESAASSRKSEAFTGAGATLRRRKDQRPSSTPSNRP
ncbi:UFD1-domain-containing protein [Ramicandelaber brevisporus]|nr:UFD1-domain-containing protein [Ramicandelaber brevisporus]